MKLRRRMLPQILVAMLVLLYLGDWIVLSLRPAEKTSSIVQVDQFLKTPLKNHKEEFDYIGTVAQPCVVSVFPHRGETPCWWLTRHKTQWLSA